MIENKEGYDLARNEGEINFIKVFRTTQYSPDSKVIRQGTVDEDTCFHYDVEALVKFEESEYEIAFIDVKDVEEQNFDTGNYSIRKKCLDFHKLYKLKNYYIAFRLVENDKRSRKFILVNTQEMLQKCKNDLKDKGPFSLISLDIVKAKCDYKLIEEELIKEEEI